MILNRTARRQQASWGISGFSLVELLIAMTLGLILTAGMFAVFSGNKRSAALNSEMANMQESMRFALNAISDDVRMAGHQGCMDLNSRAVDIVALDPPSENLQATIIGGSLIGSSGLWFPAPPLGTAPNQFQPPTTITPRVGTHALFMQFGEPPGSLLTGAFDDEDTGIPSATGPLSLARAIDIESGDLALVSTCDGGEIFRVTAASTALNGTMTLEHAISGNESAAFQQRYGAAATIDQARVMPFTTRVYYIADTGDDRADGSPIYALYQQTMPFDETNNPPVMLVEGIENMRVLFGVGGANGQLRYLSASDADYDPSQTRNVRIGLFMSSYEPLLGASDSNTYTLAGESVSVSSSDNSAAAYPDDRRLRLAFNTTVSVRNRRARE